MALYCAWSGHLHALADDAPIFARPAQLLEFVKFLYAEGSWGMRSGGNVNGILLAIVWGIEGVMIVGLTSLITLGAVSDTPFCEKKQCWLDEEKQIDTLAAFGEQDQIAALAAGDLGPLTQAKACEEGSSVFARVTLKHSPKCDEFCTISVSNVTVTIDKDGDSNENEETLAENLVLPKSMLDLIAKFENFTPVPASTGTEQETPPVE